MGKVMMKYNHKWMFVIGTMTLLVCVFLAACWMFSIRFNITKSAPVGVYRQLSGKPVRGDFTMLDLTGVDQAEKLADRGQLQRFSGNILLCKRVLGLPGDVIDRDSNGLLSVNGEIIPNSAAYVEDNEGNSLNPVNEYPYTVPSDHIFFMGVSKHSFDSRYLGPIHSTHLKSRVQILISFGDHQ